MAQRDYDVVVVGGGGAGMAAALMASDAGARVIIAESEEDLGGSTRLSGGVFFAAGTSTQRAAGYEDTSEAMFDYYMTLNQWRVEPDLAWTLCQHAAPALEWLTELSVVFPVEQLYKSGVENVPRGHAPLGMGMAIAAALEGAVKKRDIDLALATRVDRLLVEDGRVVGVSANGEAVRAGAVVLTTGGFGQNPEFLAKFYPEAAAAGDWTWSISAPGCVGDAIPLGEQAGAGFAGYDRGLLLATPGFSQQLEVDPPGWLVWVNRDGHRFIDETAPYAVMSGAMKEQGGSVFAVLDEAARVQSKPEGLMGDAFAAGMIALNFVDTVIAEQADKGRVVKADTLEELAGKAGIAVDGLLATLERYNADCQAGEDGRFFKKPKVSVLPGAENVLLPVSTPPYYAIELRPAIVCLTSYGVHIDTAARVLDEAGRPIPGLYAGGECTGGVMGERYVGGGNSIANAIVFGRIAGQTAAAEAASS